MSRRLAGLAFLAWLVAAPASAWGPAAHRAVSTEAIDTLPKALKKFYRDHRYEMPALSLEGQASEETVERRFAADAIASFPFADLPRTEAALAAAHPDTSPGRLPWLVQESYARLVEAFRTRDRQRILAESDVLAGLVADVNNPLALTTNADGQQTEQHGLWLRFSERLPEAMQKELDLDADAADYLDRPDDYVFSMILGSYIWVDNLLYQEDLARRSSPGFAEIYYETLQRRAGPILRQRLNQAAADVGSYWYTAWTAAGRPELP